VTCQVCGCLSGTSSGQQEKNNLHDGTRRFLARNLRQFHCPSPRFRTGTPAALSLLANVARSEIDRGKNSVRHFSKQLAKSFECFRGVLEGFEKIGKRRTLKIQVPSTCTNRAIPPYGNLKVERLLPSLPPHQACPLERTDCGQLVFGVRQRLSKRRNTARSPNLFSEQPSRIKSHLSIRNGALNFCRPDPTGSCSNNVDEGDLGRAEIESCVEWCLPANSTDLRPKTIYCSPVSLSQPSLCRAIIPAVEDAEIYAPRNPENFCIPLFFPYNSQFFESHAKHHDLFPISSRIQSALTHLPPSQAFFAWQNRHFISFALGLPTHRAACVSPKISPRGCGVAFNCEPVYSAGSRGLPSLICGSVSHHPASFSTPCGLLAIASILERRYFFRDFLDFCHCGSSPRSWPSTPLLSRLFLVTFKNCFRPPSVFLNGFQTFREACFPAVTSQLSRWFSRRVLIFSSAIGPGMNGSALLAPFAVSDGFRPARAPATCLGPMGLLLPVPRHVRGLVHGRDGNSSPRQENLAEIQPLRFSPSPLRDAVSFCWWAHRQVFSSKKSPWRWGLFFSFRFARGNGPMRRKRPYSLVSRIFETSWLAIQKIPGVQALQVGAPQHSRERLFRS